MKTRKTLLQSSRRKPNLEATSARSSSSQAGTSSADWRDVVQQAIREASDHQDPDSTSPLREAWNAAQVTVVDSFADQLAPTIPEEETAVDADPAEAAPVEEAATGTATEAAAPEAASNSEVPQSNSYSSTVDPTPWETGRRFQFDLRYLAWMWRADGSPMPVYGENPPNFLQGDYSET